MKTHRKIDRFPACGRRGRVRFAEANARPTCARCLSWIRQARDERPAHLYLNGGPACHAAGHVRFAGERVDCERCLKWAAAVVARPAACTDEMVCAAYEALMDAA
jgi:hypothetical protein